MAVPPLILDILPVAGRILRSVLENVAAVVLDDFTPFELGVACEVFGVDRRDDGSNERIASRPADFVPEAGTTPQRRRPVRPVCSDLGLIRRLAGNRRP